MSTKAYGGNTPNIDAVSTADMAGQQVYQTRVELVTERHDGQRVAPCRDVDLGYVVELISTGPSYPAYLPGTGSSHDRGTEVTMRRVNEVIDAALPPELADKWLDEC